MFPIRDSQPSYSKPIVTVLLIVINILVFLFEFSMDPYTLNAFIAAYGLVPDQFHVSAIFTAMFMHAGWLHVLGNMWFLWIFGDNIEDILGHGKYLLFYLLCGVAAAVAQTFLNPFSRVPMVGASGAIAGVMGAYLVKFPRAEIRALVTLVFFFFLTDVPAWAMLIYWFVIQLFSGVGSIASPQYAQGGGTAFFAHVGGFVAGIVLIKTLGTREAFSRRRDLSW
ncbi:MAG TPA: rhomboid family intramembrane serine protease [Candidatus Sulfopaludibacter sp.]|jgi:membrane associated rhomboid family serine protease|nr:rhomboid family intramembrane serine protease [Candidatus Sulfopaludibacter sp.]